MVPCMGDEDGIARSRVTAPEAKLEVRAAVGAVKLKLWALRPGKALKDLYAQAGIPAYVRVDMPKLWLNNELLLRLDSVWMFALRMIRPSTLIG